MPRLKASATNPHAVVLWGGTSELLSVNTILMIAAEQIAMNPNRAEGMERPMILLLSVQR